MRCWKKNTSKLFQFRMFHVENNFNSKTHRNNVCCLLSSFLYQPKFVWIFYRCTLPESCQLLRIIFKFPRSSQPSKISLRRIAHEITILTLFCFDPWRKPFAYWNNFLYFTCPPWKLGETGNRIDWNWPKKWQKLSLSTFYFLDWYRRRMCILLYCALCVLNCI
jgi:hypothetical protein